MKKFAKYMYETRVNKFYATLLLGLSGALAIVDHDATAFVFMLLFAIPLALAPKQIIF